MLNAIKPLTRAAEDPQEHPAAVTDRTLLQNLQSGESDDAFAILVQRHSRRFIGLAYRILGRMDEAEDVVQDGFIKLWRDPFLYSVSQGTQFTTWFYRVVTNLALDAKRRQRRAPVMLDPVLADGLMDETPLPDAGRGQHDVNTALLQALRQLPVRQQVAIELHYFDGLSQVDAAFVMQLTEKAYQSLLHRGKRGMRALLPENLATTLYE